MSEQREIATFAGGCFWCLEAVFQRIKGIKSALPGYAGGTVKNPTYEQVSTGKTGHAESIQIKFDPAQISYNELLDIFWHTHNPTTINRQNYDVGPEYRSVIFYHDEAQKQAALKSKEAFAKEGLYKDPIVTETVPYTNFYEAENYHKNYYERHKGQAYCDIIIEPKVKELLAKFGADVRPEYR